MRLILVVLLFTAGAFAVAGPIDAKVEAAMAAEGRPAADIARGRRSHTISAGPP